ncbi:hypothetical protein A1Q2_06103 [Trichosporon asahii var. asahii CBS 8904]|uniref:Uncharacterized protein n=1 Tax=Trichosporon asahii var. asahii (strain CBS 8904) TaxID=1220162 RepID=K1VSC7_TRIAC|nr:hypothetical protein A1Q2_06103 [Trichosporon asahii var. asahii CBS 8904]
MSSSHDPVIDPSLRDLPPPTRGMKRKAAAAAKASPAPSAGGRVTRRSAKEQPAPLQPPEPARGEEENLIGYGRNREASTTKRSRRRSPDHPAEWSHSGPLGGIENLAAAAAYQSNPPSTTPPSTTAPPTTYPYPFGLTPYRYPCLTPHLPQPPPGDPANPHFRAFDPAEAEAFHQSLVQNNHAYSTLASYLDDEKEKA